MNKVQRSYDSEGLSIIGAGFGRTGTKSLKIALEKLGFCPCYHMVDNFQNNHSDMWTEMTKGSNAKNRTKWDKIFAEKGYQAAIDFPACSFYKELAEIYPKAKVILTVRDPEKWWQSASETILRSLQQTSKVEDPFGLWFLSQVFPAARRSSRMVNAVIVDGSFNGSVQKENVIQAFKAHNEEVKRVIPKEKLLVFQVSDGWEPLCTFLGVPVPSEPFPHVNDTTEFQQRLRKASIVGKILFGILLLCFVLFFWLLFRFLF